VPTPANRSSGASRTRGALRVGLISDTHGLLRPAAITFLQGSHTISHGGDVGGAPILDALRRIAPVVAVRGNNDHGTWARELPAYEFITLDGALLFVVHDRSEIDSDLHARGVRAAIFGHSHKPLLEELKGVLFVNPGSAGQRRFKLPVSVGELLINRGVVTGRIVELGA
jgi:putative phosphoesterase